MTHKIVKAIHVICHNLDGEKEHTGKYTTFGDPILRAVVNEIEPGAMFDLNIFPEIEQQRLWQLGAIEELTETELALWEKIYASKSEGAV